MKKSSTTKKRRSKEHSNNEDDSSHYTNGKNQNRNCNKENIIETERLNRSANKKRLERLMNRAKDRSGSVPDNKYSRKERKSIKVCQRIWFHISVVFQDILLKRSMIENVCT